MSFSNLRDKLIALGQILEENFKYNYYILSIHAGFLNKNEAILLIRLKKNKIYIIGYAVEGLIKQNTVLDAIEKVIKKIIL